MRFPTWIVVFLFLLSGGTLLHAQEPASPPNRPEPRGANPEAPRRRRRPRPNNPVPPGNQPQPAETPAPAESGNQPVETQPANAPTAAPEPAAPVAPPAVPESAPANTPPGAGPAAPPGTTPGPANPATAAPPNAAGNQPAPTPPAANTPAEPGNGPAPVPAPAANTPGAAGAPMTAPDSRPRAPQPSSRPVREAPAAAATSPSAARPAPAPARPHRPVLLPTTGSWRSTFSREPLGFDAQTPARVTRDLQNTLVRAARSPGTLLEGLAAPVGFWFALAALALYLLVGFCIERFTPRWWRRFWTRLRALVHRSPSLGLLVHVARAAAIPLAALVLWTLGELLAGDVPEGYILVQNLLGVCAAYRAVNTVQQWLITRFHPVPANRRELVGGIRGLLRFAVGWVAGWLVLDAVGYREEGLALWLAGGHLVLVLGVFSLVVRQQRVMALLPDLDNSAYRRFVRVLNVVYLPLVVASLVVALLWVGGYRNLADVFLGRGWAVVGLLLLLFLIYQSLQGLFKRWMPEQPEQPALAPTRDEALAASRRMLALVLVIAAYALSLRILGLLDAWRYFLHLSWITAGSLRITGMALWVGALILLFCTALSRLIQAMLNYRVYGRLGIERGEAYALNRLLHYALLTGAGLLVLDNLGLSPQSLALVAGGLSVGIGFGLQDIAKNIASGLILLTSRQVRQGDIISVGDQMGKVQEVSLRSTLVTTFDNVDLLIPNSKLLDNTLINWTHGSTLVRVKLAFGVAYDTDPELVVTLAQAVAKANADILPEPVPEVWMKNLGESSLEFELAFWLDQNRSVRPRVATQLYCALFKTFKEHQIEIPFPQRDLHLRSGVPWNELLAALSGRGAAPDANGRAPELIYPAGDAPKAAEKQEGEPTARG